VPTRGSTLRLGRLAGIPIGVQPLWLLVVGLITFALGHDYFPTEDPGLGEGAAYALGLLSALALFAGILLHELGHAVVARRRGVEVDEIDLWLLGGVSRIHGEPREPGDELRFALAGPAVTAVLLAVAVALRVGVGGALPDWGRALLDYQVYVNAVILGFNLLPAFPLDGGRVARSLLWRWLGDRERATEIAAGVGRVFGWGMVVLGVASFLSGAPGGLWLALIGGFLIMAAGAEAQQLRVQHALGDVRAGELMSAPAATLPANLPLDEAIDHGFATHLFSAFPVVDGAGRAVGVLSMDDVRAVPATHRAAVLAEQAAARDPELLVAPETQVAQLLAEPAFHRVGRAVVVDGAGRPLGLLSITDVQRRLRADELRSSGAPPERRRAA
jgi:Zn-dependent protease/CBS domain-containing protein